MLINAAAAAAPCDNKVAEVRLVLLVLLALAAPALVAAAAVAAVQLGTTNRVQFYSAPPLAAPFIEMHVGDSSVSSIIWALNYLYRTLPTPTHIQEINIGIVDDFINRIPAGTRDRATLVRIFTNARNIMFHTNFRQNLFGMSWKTFMLIISIFKSCGDEYQLLTTVYLNEAFQANNQNITVWGNTYDRIYIANLLQLLNPLVTGLKVPSSLTPSLDPAVYDQWKGAQDNVSKCTGGLLVTNKSLLSNTKVDYGVLFNSWEWY